MGKDYLQQAETLQEDLYALMAAQSQFASERAQLVGKIARAEKEYELAVAAFEMWAAEQNLLGGSSDMTRKQNRANAFEIYKLDERWELAAKRDLLEKLGERDQELQIHLGRLHETLSALKLQVNLLDMQMAYSADTAIPIVLQGGTDAEKPKKDFAFFESIGSPASK